MGGSSRICDFGEKKTLIYIVAIFLVVIYNITTIIFYIT